MTDNLKVAVFQYNIAWLDIARNLLHIEHMCEQMEENTELVFLPEMFATGFTVEPDKLITDSQEIVISKIKELSKHYNCAFTGSHPYFDNGKYYNRLWFFHPDGNINFYDKRHLFSIGDENQKYQKGIERKIFEFKGWRIMPQICYDLRFPVWSRNDLNYDLLFYSANWPSVRNYAWESLLKARAIENQCFVIGINRIGKDGRDLNYMGNSQILSVNGEIIVHAGTEEGIISAILNKDVVDRFRKSFPILNDRDRFIIEN